MQLQFNNAPVFPSTGEEPLSKLRLRDGASLPAVFWIAVGACAFTAALRWLFFYFSAQIWARSTQISINDVVPWSRWAMIERDGVEAQVLLWLTLTLLVSTIATAVYFHRILPIVRIVGGAICGIGAGTLFICVPFVPPLAQLAKDFPQAILVVLSVLMIATFAYWAGSRSRTAGFLLVLLVPVCFKCPPSTNLLPDLSCILAPALRLRLGVPLRDIYFQYDALPSLIAVGWHRAGGDPALFSFCTSRLRKNVHRREPTTSC